MSTNRLFEVGLAIAAGRIHHAQFEKNVGLGSCPHGAEAGFKHFKTCHFSPLSGSRERAFSVPRCPLGSRSFDAFENEAEP